MLIQISEIRMNRGELVDTPVQLQEGEFWLTLDRGDVLIGTSTAAFPEIATRTEYPFQNLQILTEKSKSVEALLNYYPQLRDLTSLDAFGNPSARIAPQATGAIYTSLLQERIDERVSVAAFGAQPLGQRTTIPANTGATATAALLTSDQINEAIVKLALTQKDDSTDGEFAPRTIYIPAGIYFINRPLVLPKNTRLVGDGSGNTVIVMIDTTQECVIKTVAGTIQFSNISGNTVDGFDYAQIAAEGELPQNIIVEGIWFHHAGIKDVAHIISATNVTFNDVGFSNLWVPSGATPSTDAYDSTIDSMLVHIDSAGTASKSSNILFDRCLFNRGTYSSLITDDVENIKFVNCSFKNNRRGVLVGEAFGSDPGRLTAGQPKNVHVSHSEFDCIAFQGFHVADLPSQQAAATTVISLTTVASYAVGTPGAGYSALYPPTVTVTGDGTGATASVTVNSTTGAIQSITALTVGTGYTTAAVVIDPPNGELESANFAIGSFAAKSIGHTSAFNRYLRVGQGLTAVDTPGASALTEVVRFGLGRHYNVSMGDNFSRNLPATTSPRVYSSGRGRNIVLNSQDSLVINQPIFRNGRIETGQEWTSLEGASTATLYNTNPQVLISADDYDSVIVEYSLRERNSTKRSVGTLRMITDGTTVATTDSATDINGNLDVTLSADIVTVSLVPYMRLKFTKNGAANDMVMTYSYRAWKSL